MQPEQIEWLRGWARKHNCRLVIEGEVGFGRQCVGIQQLETGPMGPSWLSYQWYGMGGDETKNKEVNHIVSVARPEDAYHKDDFICVLGEGFNALEQLYQWCMTIEEAGLTTELVNEGDLGPGTTTMSQLMGYGPAKIRRLCYPA